MRVKRLAGVDTLRGLSALAVFMCHIGGYWTFLNLPWKLPGILTWGTHGVDIFIVLSGFCLMMPVVVADGDLSVRQFFGRRAWRILPAYWVALAAASVIALNPSTASMIVAAPADWSDVLIHFLGMQTWVPPTMGTINGSLWSVSLEIQLYLVFPLLILVWRRWGLATLSGSALVIAIVWNQLGRVDLGGPFVGNDHAMPARLIQFVIGMCCAVWTVRGRTPRPSLSLAAAVIAGVLGAIGYTVGWSAPSRAVIWAITGGALLLWLNGIGRRGVVSGPLETLGGRAYSFYLLHQPILLICGPLVALLPGGWPFQFVFGGLAVLIATVLAAEVLFRGVEMPSHRIGRKLFPQPVHPPITRADSTDVKPLSTNDQAT